MHSINKQCVATASQLTTTMTTTTTTTATTTVLSPLVEQVFAKVLAAQKSIQGIAKETPLEYSLHLSHYDSSGEKCANVFLKCEHLQHTGSFKLRGAANKLVSLLHHQEQEQQLYRGVVAASTGNHGAAVAYAAKKLSAKATVYVAQGTDKSKLHAISALGAQIVYHGNNCVEAEVHARRVAQETGSVFISPYNDLDVIAGQGTIAPEILAAFEQQQQQQQQQQNCRRNDDDNNNNNNGNNKQSSNNNNNIIDAVFVSVGGGGLISGIGAYLKKISSSAIRVIGCQPENSQVMNMSLKAGRILQDVEELPTISDGTAGGIEEGSITFDLCREVVDEMVTVSEDEIKSAMRFMMDREHYIVEGAAGVVVASYLKMREQFRGNNVVLVLCGRNIGLEKLQKQVL